MKQRVKVVPDATGIVLEIGIGSGLNLPLYDQKKVSHIIGVDPSPFDSKLEMAFEESGFSHDMIKASAEDLPLEDNSVDTVVTTYSFCTIPDVSATILECRRVLKSSGQLLFIEHGAAPDPKVRKTQDRVNPVWKRLAGGCHLNRDIPALMQDGGFSIEQLETMYLPGWRPATWNVWGVARGR